MNSREEYLMKLSASYKSKYDALLYENEKLHQLIQTLTGVDLRCSGLTNTSVPNNTTNATFLSNPSNNSNDEDDTESESEESSDDEEESSNNVQEQFFNAPSALNCEDEETYFDHPQETVSLKHILAENSLCEDMEERSVTPEYIPPSVKVKPQTPEPQPQADFNALQQEMRDLYGDQAQQIHELETCLQMKFDQFCDLCHATPWPIIPFKR